MKKTTNKHTHTHAHTQTHKHSNHTEIIKILKAKQEELLKELKSTSQPSNPTAVKLFKSIELFDGIKTKRNRKKYERNKLNT